MATTTGNSASATVSNAGVAPNISAKECAKLGKKNEKEREKVVDELDDGSSLNQQEQSTLDKAEGTGMTISSATSNVPGAQGTFSASSSGCAQACNPNGLVSGGTSEQKMGCNADVRGSDSPKHDEAKEKAGVLCDKSYVHPGGGKGAHAEAKIANHMTEIPGSAMEGGSMLLNIDWRFKRKSGPKQSGMPCNSCYAMLCHAQKECNIQIFICDKDNKPQPLANGDCEADDAYQDLCMRVDGNPEPGR